MKNNIYLTGFRSTIDLVSDDVLHVSNTGSADKVTIPANAAMHVSGGSVTSVYATECHKALIDVKSGGITSLTVDKSTSALIRVSGGVVSNAEFFSGAVAYVSAGGTIGMATLKDNGSMTVNNGAVVSSCRVSSGGTLYAAGTVDKTTVYGGGTAIALNQGRLQLTTVSSGGSVNVRIGGRVVSSWLSSGAALAVSDGGTADSVTVFSSGQLNVSYGGMAVDTVLSGAALIAEAEMNISRGGTADRTNAKYSANINVWGRASRSILNAGGKLYVSSGGTAVDTQVNGAGSLCVRESGIASNTVVSGTPGKYCGFLEVSSGGTASATTVNDMGMVYVFDGGYATGTVISAGGAMHVNSGGTANENSIFGALYVFESGVVSGGDIHGGIGYISAGGTAYGVNLDDEGKVRVLSGASAVDMKVNNKGSLCISGWGYAERASVFQGGSVIVSSMGMIMSAALSGGKLYLENQGSASRTFVNGGEFRVHALVEETTISAGSMVVSRKITQPGNIAVGAFRNVLFGGNASVCSGASAHTNTIYGGIMRASSGGSVVSTTILGSGSLVVHSGGFASKCMVSNGGSATVYGTMDGLDIKSGGSVLANGTVRNISLSGGILKVRKDGILTGNLFLYSGTVQMDSKSTIKLDISKLSDASLVPKINRWKVISGTPECQITVSATQALGNYAIAGDAAGFTGTVTVKDTSGNSVGTVSVGESLLYEGQYYKLRKVSSNLLLTVSDTMLVLPEVLSVSANLSIPTDQNVLVTANFSENSIVQEYSFDKKEWMSYNTYVEMSENGTVYFRSSNETGTSAIASYTVSNIDKTPPAAPVVTVSTEAPTEGPVLLTVKYSEDSVHKLYSVDSVNWLSYTAPITVSANGSWFFRGIDEAGNISNSMQTVTNIVKYGVPTAPVPSANITKPTNQDVTVSAKFSADSVKKEYSLDSKTWLPYTGGVKFNANGTVYFRGTNAAGKSSSVISYKVTNIDKIPPASPKVSADITAVTDQKVTVSASFSSDTSVKQYSHDGKTWKTYSGPIVFSSNGKVYFRGIDNEGNISAVTSYTVVNIDKTSYKIKGDVLVSDLQVINLNYSGKYTLTGTFGSDVNGSVTVFSGGKKAGTGSIQNGVLNFNPGKEMLLDKSLETVAQISIKNGTSTAYNLELVPVERFMKADNSDDTLDGRENLGELSSAGTFISNGWVGFGDAVDFYEFSLGSAARLSLRYTASDAVRFTLCNSLMKPLIKTALKANTELLSKPKLVEAGVYYLSVQSTNAKKGGSADYTAAIDEQTVFFTKGDHSDDSIDTAKNIGSISSPRTIASDWVGYGDAIDYKSFTLSSAAKLNFTLTSSDSVKFTVWQDAGTGLKSVLKASLKGGSVNTKDVLVTEGVCYFSIQSSNAKKGGSADYTVEVNGTSEFFPKGDHTNDSVAAAFEKTAKKTGEKISGWVGFGDAADYIRFTQSEDGRIQLKLDGATADAYASKKLKITCLDASGKSVSFAWNGDSLEAKKETLKGDCCLGVRCSNVKKFNASYGITTGVIASVV